MHKNPFLRMLFLPILVISMSCENVDDSPTGEGVNGADLNSLGAKRYYKTCHASMKMTFNSGDPVTITFRSEAWGLTVAGGQLRADHQMYDCLDQWAGDTPFNNAVRQDELTTSCHEYESVGPRWSWGVNRDYGSLWGRYSGSVKDLVRREMWRRYIESADVVIWFESDSCKVPDWTLTSHFKLS